MWTSGGLAALLVVGAASALLEGPNVCTRQEPYVATIRVSEQQAYQVKEYAWCFNVPPQCSKYKIKFRPVFKTQTLVKYRPVEECCAGYAPDERGEQCVPVCVDKCVHGKCVAPNTCSCKHGYGGPACDISCPDGKWGRDCQHSCRCRNGGTCEPLTGECACAPGWRGDACERACATNTFGEGCNEVCQCQTSPKNGTQRCDPVSGACDCLPGFTGPLCEKECPYGSECPQGCRCQNNGKCNVFSGKCECAPGWTGEVCANKCPTGKWGENCEKTCECANGAGCHHVIGKCQCEPGFTGEKCLESCPHGTYGLDCFGTCSCQHGGECSPRDGSCTCKPGWKGKFCEVRACPDNMWGARCEKQCECNPATTDMCDPWTGACDCSAGWGGEICSRQCPLLTYGKGCRSTCRCENSGLCSPVNGSCTCAPGYRGLRCEEPCPYPYFGDNCADTCDCVNNATCSHETGRCNCKPGFHGLKCDRQCDGTTFGIQCRQPCDCENGAPCNAVTGECICGPGYQGKRCEHRCPPWYFGQNCTSRCECSANAASCDHVTGRCECATSWRDVLGTPMLSNTMCDVTNEAGVPQPAYGNILYLKPISKTATTSYKLKLKPKKYNQLVVNSVTENIKSKIMPQIHSTYGSFKQISLNQCLSWTVNNNVTELSTILSTAVESLRKFETFSPYIVVAVLDITHGIFSGNSSIWKISVKDNGVYVNNIFSGVLVKLINLGIRCETLCPQGHYGEKCAERCACVNNSSCDAETGRCVCAAGWTGENCSEPCRPGTYGAGCTQLCAGSPNDNKTCDPVTGRYACPSGYTGARCEYPCSVGTYGDNCEQKCNCKNGADCHHVTGLCQCSPGWRGPVCGEACQAGWWGAGCTQPCRCARGAACRPNDGFCRCPPGYTGNYCTQFCPEGYYGDHCMQPCDCPSSGNWVCDPVQGCICHRGYIGDNCDIHAADSIVIDPTTRTSNTSLTVVLVILALVCATAAVLVLMYYRKRVHNLKREIAHVHYTVDPKSQPEQQHNPVYAFQGSTSGDDSTTLLNNATHILNNLGSGSKLNNSTMEKMRMKATGSNENYDPFSSLKNKDADATNPNLYHSIDDDNKLDHVYDEIKHKEGYEMEYDHLDYTPPANKWKAHYQRMANGFTVPNASGTAPVPVHSQHPPATPPIPPLPKLNIAPIPPKREEQPLNAPIPPKREDIPPMDDDNDDSS